MPQRKAPKTFGKITAQVIGLPPDKTRPFVDWYKPQIFLVPVLMTTVPELPEVIWVGKKVARLTNESPLTYTVFANEPVKATKRQ